MKAKLTKRFVESIQPGERDIVIWDTELPGFGVKVTPRGKRSYFCYYRVRDSRQQRRPFLGPHGVLTCEEARREARQILAAAFRGEDPSGARQAGRRAETVADLCDRFLEEVCPRKRETTAREYRRLIERHIRPTLGRLRVKDVTTGDVARLHHAMRETPRNANYALSVLSRLMTQAVRWQMRQHNPCRGAVDRYPEAGRARFLSELELAGLGKVLADAERDHTELPGVIRAIRLLALTGRRVGDIVGLKWEQVDFDGACLRLPSTKTGPQEVTLGAPALALLAGMEHVGEYVAHGADPDTALSAATLGHAWRRIRKQAEIPDVRLHDLRHGFATFAGQTGAGAFLVRDALGHKTLAMTGRYVERDVDPLRALTDKVQERIEAAMSGKSGEVVDHPRRRG